MRSSAFILLLLIGGSLPALETVPRGVFGVPIPGTTASEDEDAIVGGSAVLIGTDGMVITLAEAVPDDATAVTLVLPGGARRSAKVIRRGERSSAVLLSLPFDGLDITPVPLADSDALRVGDTVWSVGNPFGAVERDGLPAISRGIVSGRYELPPDSPLVRGRRGAVLSRYRGPVIETTAAINDGNHGGALVDDAGALVGLASLGVAHERKMGTAVPLALVLADLGLPPARIPPRPQDDPVRLALRDAAAAVADCTVLVYFERPRGPGNPAGIPRPRPIDETTPAYRRQALAGEWDRYYHQQQMWRTDQALTAVVIDAERGYLITALSNLHGEACFGRIIDPASREPAITVWLKGTRPDLDLALLKADRPLANRRSVPLTAVPGLQTGDPVGIVGRHRDGGPFTLTEGVIAAIGRRLPHDDDQPGVEPLHQTDARANYGNLGGPVVDIDGRVVGLAVLQHPAVPWLLNSGVGMFIDSGRIVPVLPDLLQVKLGIGIRLAAEGMRIVGVLPGTGAFTADLRYGDQVTQVDGEPVGSPPDLDRVLGRHRPGDTITLTILREGTLHEARVVLAEF
jgi:S1-C subfamily serine protease